MSAPRHLSSEAVRFRKHLIDRLWDDRAFGYINEDVFLGTCVICGLAVEVQFAGMAPRARLICQGGCTEAEIAARIGLAVTQ